MEFVTSLRGSFDPAKPSLFELLSEHQLNALLPPTIRYLLTLLTHRYPRYLLRLANSFDEVYALLSLLVERHYLLTRAGSFTEHFYGLKREKSLAAEIPRASASSPDIVREALALRTGDIYKNLAVMVGIPYLKRKLDEHYEIDAPRALLGAAYNAPPPSTAPFREKLSYYYRLFLRKVYPSLNAAYYLSLLGFNLAYLFDNTKYHSPFMWLINTRIRRMTGADYAAIEASLSSSPSSGSGSSPTSRARNYYTKLLTALSLVLPTSIFALKFLEWWYASDFAKQLSKKSAEALDLPPPVAPGVETNPSKILKAVTSPPPPAKPENEKENQEEEEEEEIDEEEQERKLKESAPIAATSLLPILTVPAPKGPEAADLCPICEGEIVTAAACQTGIVYCYACIHKWLTGTHARQEKFMSERDRVGKWESGEGRCAVTGRRVLGGTEGLRRIMV
ncbi:Pex12 amino terminal region-domain-containing protein [Podospora australis]|uniref:Peroxisome assembly protein 12 n=1 Tax=Podospora australis TaxID=1536484 RepID=A0AAN6X267_9PEZI|nr:Pex12 amino terminal region-domain-containing protein [Podospora australis]